ncbi:MAG TPA: ABC transporter permease [Opitutaceae bacterium]|nr:ABC transporter permease [Opitutaceae bacterium]
MPLLDQLRQDLRFGARGLARQPGLTAVIVLILALGIGATAAIFSVVDGILLKPLAFDQPGQLFQAFEIPPDHTQNNVSPGVFKDWCTQSTLCEGFAAYSGASMNLTGSGEAVRLSGLAISANGFRLLRSHPVLGRTFADSEGRPGNNRVVVLALSLWRSRFGGEDSIVGRAIQLNGEDYTVIGVVPDEQMPRERNSFAVPLLISPSLQENRNGHWLNVIGRLKPGVTVEQGRAELHAIAARQKPLYPAWKAHWTSSLFPLDEQLTREARPSLVILVCAVASLFAIACANVANLLLARASAREREMAVRAALGASRARIVRQLLTESVLLAVLGGGLGASTAFASIGALRQLAGAMAFPRATDIALSPLILGLTLALALLTGLAFGLAPALQASRPELTRALKEGGRGSEGRGARLRSGLIIAEIALSLVLLVGAGLMLRSFRALAKAPLGFEPDHALTLSISLAPARYHSDELRRTFFESVAERVAALPGVQAAGLADQAPLSRSRSDRFFRIPGWSGDKEPGFDADYNVCTPDYFKAVGIPLERGRPFLPADFAQHRSVAIINEAMARQCFAGENPIGRTIFTYSGPTFTTPTTSWTIVGIIGDVRSRDLALAPKAAVYLCPGVETWRDAILVVRTAGDPQALAEPIRQAILGLDSNQPVAGVRTLAALVDRTLAMRQMMLWLLSFFAGSALLLAGIGLYGVIAYVVSQRTREFGIRAALGATPENLLGLVLRRGVLLASLGLGAGIGVALGATRLMTRLLYNVRPGDPLTFAGVTLLLLAVALVASWLPARRAAQADPLVALRAD